MQTINGSVNEEQRTDAWHKDRMGKFSASQFYRLMTEPKLKVDKEAGNLSQGAMTYVYECVAERLTGQPAKEQFTSKYTDHGNMLEPIAKGIYEAVFNCKVIDSKYIARDEYSGGSPDGLIGENGLIEIKCPYTITSHLEHKLTPLSEIPNYYWQCLGYLLITGREWIDFVSYHGDFEPKLQLVRKRILAVSVANDLQRLAAKIKKASIEFNNLIEKLK